jgi:small basic protein
MRTLLFGSDLVTLFSEIAGLFVTATFFAVAAGVGAYIKGRFPGNWMVAGFFLGPIAFVVLLFKGDD